jgi:superfamily I DNA/RNA helicase
MSDFVPSQRQLDIFSIWQNRDSNILINAVAGSGKTTTLLQLLEYCEYRTLFLAFNKSVQEEIQAKIEARGLAQGKAMTMHSLGLSAIRKSYRRFKINNGKNFDILKKVQDKNRGTFRSYIWKDRIRIGYTLMDMNDVSRLFLTTDIEEISKHFLSMDKTMFNFEHLEELWEDFVGFRDEYYDRDVAEIDFTDMIYVPVIKDLVIPIDPYYLMIDEAQDLNLCQHKLIDNLINQGTVQKWIAVGDRNQSIYGFSGAYSSSFDLFKQKGNVEELPLDICYRCATSIVDIANEVYPVMEYSTDFSGTVEYVSNPALIKPNSMVICRNSEPLINLYFQLLGLGKDCYIKGEDILNSIIRFLKPYKSSSVGTAKVEMLYKIDELSRDTTDDGRLELYIFKENFANFKKLAEHFCESFETVDTLLNRLKSLFINKENAIMLCTIHKSKGLEADIVYILNEDLIPSRFAKSAEQLKQENNLKYVARTRAKEELYFLDL